MHKTFIKVLLALMVIAIVSYFLQNRGETLEACTKIDGYWNGEDKTCEETTEKIIFQSLSKPHPVSVVYPENERLVLLDTIEQIEKNIFFQGHYDALLAPAEGELSPVYDRGTVYLNMSKITLLDDNRTDITYFAAPFIINTSGSGVFVYVGLFSYDFTKEQAKHLSSELLGNRVQDENIIVQEKSVVKDNVFVQEGMIKVNFKSHGPKQPAAEYPTQDNTIKLQLVALDPNDDTNATFRRIIELHKSWDLDQDGVNDCEKDNSCDHLIDYSQAKSE
jgi:hypothetical protein